MTKDDYFVIVYKILAYLYKQLKSGENVDVKMLQANSSMLKINERYWTYIFENLVNEGYIRNVGITKAMGHETIITDLSDCEITPAGIAYVSENSSFKKVKKFLKEAKEITPFF